MAELTEYHRLCPICGKMIYHTSKCNRNRLDKLKCLCKECLGKSQRKSKTDMLVRKCPKCNSEIWYNTRKAYNQADKRNSMCKMCVRISRPRCSAETRAKISAANVGSNNGMYGKTHTDEYRRLLHDRLINDPLPITLAGIEKMRIGLRKNAVAKMQMLGMSAPRVNAVACRFMDTWGNANGYNFRHGMNGGEIYLSDVGVFLDGYDSEKNVVFEYDEPHHYDYAGMLRKKDTRRMYDIIHKLHCKVVRYNERLGQITEYTNYEPQSTTKPTVS